VGAATAAATDSEELELDRELEILRGTR
jgi:hypothetical protein